MGKLTPRKRIIVALALATLPILALSPAFAASKVMDVKTRNVPMAFPTGAVCTTTGDDFTGKLSAHSVAWSNGHLEVHILVFGKLTDPSSGVHTGQVHQMFRFNLEPANLPSTVQNNVTATCLGQGNVSTFRFGFTVDENGRVHPH